MPARLMDHQDNDPRTLLLDKLGDLGDFEVFNNQVLVAIYVRPQRTKSGIYLTDKAIDEDVFQGKVGLMVKTGPTAFADPDGQWFKDAQFEVQDWLALPPPHACGGVGQYGTV